MPSPADAMYPGGPSMALGNQQFAAMNDMPLGLTEDKATYQRRMEIRRAIEAGGAGKIGPEEFDMWKEEHERWNALPSADRKKIRQQRRMEEDVQQEQEEVAPR